MVVATSVHEQLDEKVAKLRQVSDQLRNGDFLRQAMTLARDQKTWTGKIQQVFCFWLDDLNGWMRIQLSSGIGAVADKVAAHSAALLNAENQIKAGIPPGPIPPPTRIGTVPGRPPDFNLHLTGGGMSAMDPAPMKDLVKALGQAKDQLFEASLRVKDALSPPVSPPIPVMPGAPPPPPVNHIPDDAADAAGSPGAFQALARCLDAALFDVLDRARKLDGSADPLPAASSIDVSGLAATGAAAVDSASTAQQQATDAAIPAPAEAPPAPPPLQETPVEQTGTPEQMATAQHDADVLADRYHPPEKVLDDPERVKALSEDLKKHHGNPGDSAFAAEFVKRFGAKNVVGVARTLQAWQYGYRKEMQFPPGSHERGIDYEHYGRDRPSEKDVQGILYSFCATLATASPSLDSKTADQIMATDDPQALSWLMSNPDAKFSKEFLVKVFDRVEQQIIRDAQLDNGITGPPPPGPGLAGLGPDLKVGILDAISRNPEAAEEIVNRPEFKKPIDIPRGALPPVDVTNVLGLLNQGSYSDKGEALGRMFDAAHASLYSRDPAAAKGLVDRYVLFATDRKEVSHVQKYLGQIGARQRVTPGDAQRALDEVRKSPNAAGREALLAMAGQVQATATDFAQAATDAAARKVKPSKSPELKELYETESAWEVVPTLQGTPATINLAETMTEQGVLAVGKNKQELNDAARRGMAKAVSAHAAGFAQSIASSVDPESGASAEMRHVHVSFDHFVAAMADLMKDRDARHTIEASAGNLAGSWSAQAASRFLDGLLGREQTPQAQAAVDDQGRDLGKYLCSVVKATRKSAENKAQEEVDALWGMRLGMDAFFMGVDFATSFLPGAKVLTQTGDWLLDKGLSKTQEGLGAEGMPDALEGGIKGYFERGIQSKEKSAWDTARKDVKSSVEEMGGTMVRDGVARSLLDRALALPPPERDLALGRMGIRCGEYQGVQALGAAGLIGADGKVRIPSAGTPEYRHYEDWLKYDSSSFSGMVGDVGAKARASFTDCLTGTHETELVKKG